MTIPQPNLGEVVVITEDADGNDVTRRYRISLADYSLYRDRSVQCLCIHAEADKLMEPEDFSDWENAQPWVEVRLTFQTAADAELVTGKTFRTPAYNSETDEWLTNFYHFSHGGLEDAEVKVLSTTDSSAELEISGFSEAAGSPVKLKARFEHNQERRPNRRSMEVVDDQFPTRRRVDA